MAEPPQKKFRYTTYNDQIKNISVDVGRKRGLGWEKDEYDEDTEQTSTPFTAELDRLSLLDLTVPYQELQRTLLPLTNTLPITLHNIPVIQETFFAFYAALADGHEHTHSGLDSALFLHQALYETCLGETLAYVPETARHLLRIGALRALDPKLVERTYSTLSLILRTIASPLLKSDELAKTALRKTWDEVRPYLRPRENKRYVRKCVADAWTGVIRKARSDGLTRLMSLLAEADEQEGMEAVWAHSMKGTSGQLHSRALPIYTILLDHVVASPGKQRTATLGLVTMALVHHTSAEVMKPVVEVVLARVGGAGEASSSASPTSLPSSAAVLSILTTLLVTRKGKRFPETLLKPTMLRLQSLIPLLSTDASLTGVSEEVRTVRGEWRQALVTAIVGALQAGKLAQWLSPGVAVIDSLWDKLDVRECFAFVNALVALKWAGVEQFLLSHVARTSLPSLTTDTLPTLVLLNNLASAGFLSGGLTNVQSGRWRQSLISALVTLLRTLLASPLELADRRILGQVLRLLPALPADAAQFAPHVVDLARRALLSSEGKTSAELEAEWATSNAWNDSHVVGALLRAMDELVTTQSEGVREVVQGLMVGEGWAGKVLERWGWNREVLGGVAGHVERWAGELGLSHDDLVARLTPNLLSSDTSLRLSSLRILTAIAPSSSLAPPSTSSDPTPTTSAQDIWNLCVSIESAEMSLKNVRERTTAISRLARTLVALLPAPSSLPPAMLKAATVYLVAQLKVNFRPVYPEAIAALAALCDAGASSREVVWETVWAELEKTNAAKVAVAADLGVEKPAWATARADKAHRGEEAKEEEEAEFRCPNAEKSRQAVGRAWGVVNEEGRLDSGEISAQVQSDRLDVLNYEAQLLAMLAAVPSVAEKHSRVIVPVFFSVARQGGEPTAVDDAAAAPASASHLSTKQLQARTASYLELLTKFVNPKAAFRSDDLHALYLSLLSKGEPKLQALALNCLMTYKSPALLPYGEAMGNLLVDSKFRDELARLRLGMEGQVYARPQVDNGAADKTRVVVIEPGHRAEALPVMIRLLYGIMTSRRGRSSSAQGQGARKTAVLNALSGCASSELGTLVDLMLEPFAQSNETGEGAGAGVTGRQQMGFLTLLTDVIRYLGPQLGEHWERLVETTVEVVAHAQKRLTAANVVTEDAEEGQQGEVAEEDEGEEGTEKGLAPLRNIRSTGLKRLVQFLRSPVEFSYAPYLPRIFTAIISPRLDRLEVENTQAPSGTLDLIATLASTPETARALVKLDERTLPKAFACMTAVKVKPAVVLRVFDMVDALLLDPAEDDEGLTREVLVPHVRVLIDNIIGLVATLKAAQNDDITRRLLGILSRLAGIVEDGQQAQQLAALLAPMLRQRQLPEKAKINILATLQRLYAISPDFAQPESKFFRGAYDLIASLFQTLYHPASRRALVGVLETFAKADPELAEPVRLVGDLNAYSAKRLDEPDFDKRLDAYATLNDAADEALPQGTRAWSPILRTALFFLFEPEELSIRTNASALLQRFITLVGPAAEGAYVDQLVNVVLPGIKKALKSKVELVRNEALLVLAHGVRVCKGVEELNEMRPLLADGDDEASFFTNITHIQVHRRARALRRLRETVADPATSIREATLVSVFLPVLEHIIAGATDVTDHHLVNEAVLTVGGLAGELRWAKWYGLIGRYMKLGMGAGKTGQQKYYVRSVAAVIDGFHFELEGGEMEVDGEEEAEVEGDEEDEDAEEEAGEKEKAVDGASSEKITFIILNRLLPSLTRFVAQKDEADSAVRVPLALGVVKIAHALPRASSDDEVLRVITTVAQILRSREQDTRDITRETICKIAVYLGPEWLVRVIKELEVALPRGPQKHVLAVTTHAILVQATTQAGQRFGNLDSAVELAVQVAAEVIWGESGKDVAAEGFKTKMREVRGATSRGFDTLQLLATLVSPSKIGAVLAPLREVMHASQAVKPMQQVDEALRRISTGLNSNSQLRAEDLLSLCYSLISGNSSYLKAKKKAARPAETPDAFKVVMKREAKGEEDFYPLNAHKFVVFGLDLFVTAFRRGRFDFDDVSILSRLGPMVNAVGNTLYSPASNVILLALKASAAIARCPVPQMEPALPVYITNIFKIIKHAGGTAESEVVQTALKTLAVILRDCKTSEVTEAQLRYLLEVVSPDIEEHDRQSAIFAVLRSIIARKFVVPEIYDLMDRVSSIMVTSQSTQVQALCRGAVMAFLLDYPQGKGRLKAQMTFFARNLEYTYEAGRLSVMEVLSTVFAKFSDELVEEYAGMYFVALVVVLANDDSEKCRTAAGALLQVLWKRLDEETREKMAEVVKSWVAQRGDNVPLGGAALGVLGLLVETGQGGFGDIVTVVQPVIRESARALLRAEESTSDITLDFTLPHQALSTTAKVVLASPASTASLPWADIVPHLLFPHDHVRYGTARLLANLFAGDADASGVCQMLGDEMCLDIARKGCLVLKGGKNADGEWAVVSGKLADEVVKVLYNLSKYWATSTQPAAAQDGEQAENDADEEEPTERNPLSWLMSRMSFLARHLIVSRPAPHSARAHEQWSAPILSILRFFAGVTECLSKAQAIGFLVHILSPVYRILDEGGDLGQVEDSQIDALRALALQIREFVQTKTGTTAFSRAWETLRQSTQAKRQGRKDERVRMAVAEPEKWAERKGKKVERGKEGKKRKMAAFSEGRRSSNMKKRKQ
ncbi:hypothetical protein IAT38_005685 [Cryptococcus sp. DSM 104549]